MKDYSQIQIKVFEEGLKFETYITMLLHNNNLNCRPSRRIFTKIRNFGRKRVIDYFMV